MNIFQRIKRLISRHLNPKSQNEEIQENIKHCEDAIFIATRDIYLLKKEIVTLLEQTFNYDKKFKYEEIENIQEIFNSEVKQNISSSNVNEVIEICSNYIEQINVRKIKIDFLKQNKKELSIILEQYLSLEAKIKSQEFLNELIQKNKLNINQISEIDKGEEFEINMKIDNFREEIRILNSKLADIKEFNNQLKVLQNKYSNQNKTISSRIYAEEIKKLTDKKKFDD